MVISLHYMKHYLTLKTQVKTPVKKRNKQQTFNKLQKEANGSHRSSQYQFPPINKQYVCHTKQFSLKSIMVTSTNALKF